MTDRLIEALHGSPSSSTRMQAALAAGTDWTGTEFDVGLIDALVRRCGVEPDFFVRDMMTWALTRGPADLIVPRLVEELHSPTPQARAQALHTLSKIGDRAVWPAITPALLHDPDDAVARTAWRTAVILVPDDHKCWLATELITELGRGDRDTRRSLSRAMAALGDHAVEPLATARASSTPAVREHAGATERLLADPDGDITDHVDDAQRARRR